MVGKACTAFDMIRRQLRSRWLPDIGVAKLHWNRGKAMRLTRYHLRARTKTSECHLNANRNLHRFLKLIVVGFANLKSYLWLQSRNKRFTFSLSVISWTVSTILQNCERFSSMDEVCLHVRKTYRAWCSWSPGTNSLLIAVENSSNVWGVELGFKTVYYQIHAGPVRRFVANEMQFSSVNTRLPFESGVRLNYWSDSYSHVFTTRKSRVPVCTSGLFRFRFIGPALLVAMRKDDLRYRSATSSTRFGKMGRSSLFLSYEFPIDCSKVL